MQGVLKIFGSELRAQALRFGIASCQFKVVYGLGFQSVVFEIYSPEQGSEIGMSM